MEVECPRCRKRAPDDAGNPFRPFCSQRCRLLDLGAWIDEDYRVPGAPEAESEETPPSDRDDPSA